MKESVYKAIITTVYYDDDEEKNQFETIIVWAKDEIDIGRALKDRYGDTLVSYEVKWLNEGVLVLPEDADIIEKIIAENSY